MIRVCAQTVLAVGMLLVAIEPASGAPRLATTHNDFLQPGTQPSASLNNFATAAPLCQSCHGIYTPTDVEPWDSWVASMMAQAARDPATRAAARVANQDAAGSGETCIRCHAPIGWLAGRSASAEFANLTDADRDGVTCHFCHRMLDPIARANAPAQDASILAALDAASVRPNGTCRGNSALACVADADCSGSGPCDIAAGQGRFVVDPDDSRRGPFDIPFAAHDTVTSPFYRAADACAPCHDVSTTTYTRQPDGTYALNALDAPHPTQNPHDMFPEQRTYSEWRASAFAAGGVVFPDGRFGGALTGTLPNTVPVSTCQDCHMPDARAQGCYLAPQRPDMPRHDLNGANTWVLGAVFDEYGAASGLTTDSVAAASARTATVLAAAADLEVVQEQTALAVRVVNQAGHKLPTGYPEGRRMWLNVRFFVGADPTPIGEDGAYDSATATLDAGHTVKIYETRHIVDAATAAATGLTAGTRFHLVLSNRVDFDNRIPPRGFTNTAFDVAGAAPVGQTYADGQHWDDTRYPIPPRATRAQVRLYYQTTSREYAEFLRATADDGSGANFHQRWEARGQSAPLVMNERAVALNPQCAFDADLCCSEPVGLGCDDDDPCSQGDACASERCSGSLAGFEGVRCELDYVRAPSACDPGLPKRLHGFLHKRLRRMRRLATAAEQRLTHGAKPEVVRQLLERATKVLAPVDERVLATVTSQRPPQRISTTCARTLEGAIDRLVAVLRQMEPS